LKYIVCQFLRLTEHTLTRNNGAFLIAVNEVDHNRMWSPQRYGEGGGEWGGEWVGEWGRDWGGEWGRKFECGGWG
jgi:hypothetical protein